MTHRSQAAGLVVEFLRDVLAGGALGVPETRSDGPSGWTSRRGPIAGTSHSVQLDRRGCAPRLPSPTH